MWVLNDGDKIEGVLLAGRNGIVTIRTGERLAMFSLDRFAEADRQAIVARFPGAAAKAPLAPPQPVVAKPAQPRQPQPAASPPEPDAPPNTLVFTEITLAGIAKGELAPNLKSRLNGPAELALFDFPNKLKLIVFHHREDKEFFEFELPMLKDLYARYHHKGLEVFEFLTHTKYTEGEGPNRKSMMVSPGRYRVIYEIDWHYSNDTEGKISEKLGAIYSPTCILVDQNNRVAGCYNSAVGLEPVIRAFLIR